MKPSLRIAHFTTYNFEQLLIPTKAPGLICFHYSLQPAFRFKLKIRRLLFPCGRDFKALLFAV